MIHWLAGVSDSVLIQIDNLGVPRVGILNTFAGEYSDSVEVSGNRFYGNTSGIYVNGGTLKVIGNEIKSGVNGINYNYGVGYLEGVNNVIRDNSGWGMYLYGVSGGVARGNLVSGNGSGVYIWDDG